MKVKKIFNKYSLCCRSYFYGEPRIDNVGFHPPFKDKFNLINEDELIRFGVLTGDIVITSTNKNWDEIDEDLKLLNYPVYFYCWKS